MEKLFDVIIANAGVMAMIQAVDRPQREHEFGANGHVQEER